MKLLDKKQQNQLLDTQTLHADVRVLLPIRLNIFLSHTFFIIHIHFTLKSSYVPQLLKMNLKRMQGLRRTKHNVGYQQELA